MHARSAALVESEYAPERVAIVREALVVEPEQASLTTLLDALNTAASPDALRRVHAERQPLDAEALLLLKNETIDLERELSKVHEDLERESGVTYGLTQLTSTALMVTAGAVSWLLRTSSLATIMITSLPAWVRFDALPILEDEKKRLGEDEEFEAWREDRELDDLFDAQGKTAEGTEAVKDGAGALRS
jgi:hypothetical protein